QRRAGLIAVERAMAGGVEPERALPLPDLQRIGRLAGSAAFVAGATRAIILGSGAAEIGAEAEAVVGQRNPPAGIAFARGDAVAEPRDDDVAHPDLGGDPLRRLRPARHLHRGHRLAAVADAQAERLGAVERGSLRSIAVLERPGAGGADRDRA